MHNESEAKRPNMEERIETRLSKYVRSNHPAEKNHWWQGGQKKDKKQTKNWVMSTEQVWTQNIEGCTIIWWLLQSHGRINWANRENKTWSLVPRPDDKNKDVVFKLHKALYGLKQAPITWYKRLQKYLVKIAF